MYSRLASNLPKRILNSDHSVFASQVVGPQACPPHVVLGINSGPHPQQAGTLLTESRLQLLIIYLCGNFGLPNCLPCPSSLTRLFP